LVLKQEVQAHSQLDVQDITAKAQLNINATVDHIFEVVTNLIHTTAFKAAVPDLMLLPIPPAQLLLVNLRAAKGNLGALRTLAALNDLFNARFADKLISFQDSLAPEQRVFTLDITTIWHKFIEDPASAKLTVVDQPCLTKSGVCNSPDSYFFWDTLHPTTHVHKQLALMMASEIKR
jgi:phospholipase/lecithinase/hemolysin